LCAADDGTLWGISLCGPIVIADAATGTIATNQPAPDAPKPRAIGFANAAMMWGDTRWTTIVWPLIPDDPQLRRRLLAHELFHRVQFTLKLMVNEGDTAHLDTLDGRYLLQMEWRALAAALQADVDEAGRTQAVRDALAFRAARHAAFPAAANGEHRLVINEGLAQYTGTVLAAPSRADARADARQQLIDAAASPTFVRTFAYPLGAAYGLLLDDVSPAWTRAMTSEDDLPVLLMAKTGLSPTPDLNVAASRYDGTALKATEVARDTERQQRLAVLTRRYVDGPVLVVPAGKNATFVTAGLTPLPGHGTVYQQYGVSGEWGSLNTTGILVSTDRTTLTLAGPFTTDGATLTGDGWTVTVADGWQVQPGSRAGHFVLIKKQIY
jgi:hypothetical protein